MSIRVGNHLLAENVMVPRITIWQKNIIFKMQRALVRLLLI